jgi:outer membrane protein
MMKRTRVRLFRSILLGSFAIICSGALSGQTASQPLLPDAPPSRLIANAPRNLSTISQVAAQAPETTSGSSAPGQPTHLTRIEAEQMAIKNNPRVTVGRLLALAQHQVVRELRSAELPSATGNITAEDAEDGSRISAGSLTASRLFTHAGAGATATQLITDFGRTKNLVAS